MKYISNFYLSDPLKYVGIFVVAIAMILSLLRHGYAGNDISPVPDNFFPIITLCGILFGICLKGFGFSCKEILKTYVLLLLFVFFLVSVMESIVIKFIIKESLSFEKLIADIACLMPACSAFFWGMAYVCIYLAIPNSTYHTAIVVLLILTSHLLMVNFTDKELFWMWMFNLIPGIRLRYMVKSCFFEPGLETFFYFKFW